MMELPDASLAYMDGLQQVSSMVFGEGKFVRLFSVLFNSNIYQFVYLSIHKLFTGWNFSCFYG